MILSITRNDFKLKTKHWILLTTILALTFSEYIPGIGNDLAQKLKNLDLFYSDTRPGAFNYWTNWKTLLKGTLIPLLFIIIIIFELIRFTRDNRNKPKKTLLSVLLTIIFLFFFSSVFMNFLYQKLGIISNLSMIEWPVDIVFLSIIIGLLSLITLLVNSGVAFLPPSKYASSSLHEGSYNEMLIKLSQLIQEKQLYKDCDLNLQVLARELHSNTSYISQAINHGLSLRFNDYINQFRIEEAKRQLGSSENKHLTIEAIAELCGFKSKSTFFRAFKKETGLTPKKYLIAQQKSFD